MGRHPATRRTHHRVQHAGQHRRAYDRPCTGGPTLEDQTRAIRSVVTQRLPSSSPARRRTPQRIPMDRPTWRAHLPRRGHKARAQALTPQETIPRSPKRRTRCGTPPSPPGFGLRATATGGRTGAQRQRASSVLRRVRRRARRGGGDNWQTAFLVELGRSGSQSPAARPPAGTFRVHGCGGCRTSGCWRSCSIKK
jgi:hypothetical protein